VATGDLRLWVMSRWFRCILLSVWVSYGGVFFFVPMRDFATSS
jgi:hypothetical protein